MKINAGDYVRTPRGVAKIIDEKVETIQWETNGNAVSLDTKTYISDIGITIADGYPSSPNIIDLIEEGDYVNGDEVHRIGTDYDGKKILYYIVPTDYGEEEYRNEDIKSVVTKEQFSAMEYRINE